MSKPKEIAYKYIIPWGLVAAILLLGFILVRQLSESYGVYSELQEQKEELQELEQDNEELRARIENFGSPETIDSEARKRLNLKKEGEHVVVILPPEGEQNTEVVESEEDKEQDVGFWQKVKTWFGFQ